METKSFFQSRSTQISLKLIFIFFLTLLLLIPKFMILDLIQERQALNESVIDEVSTGWGGQQIHTGPILVLPYYHFVPNEDKSKPDVKTKSNLIILPDDLSVDGNITTESKYRSLYKVLLYKSEMKVDGKFTIPDSSQTSINPVNYIPHEAKIVMGIQDPKGINSKVVIDWNGQSLNMQSGTDGINFLINPYAPSGTIDGNYQYSNSVNDIKTGMHTKVPITISNQPIKFSYQLDLKGSKSIQLAPVGKNTEVHLTSSFNDPIFIGGFLPEHTTTPQGFDANWKVLEYNKSIPSFFKQTTTIDLSNNIFGVQIKSLVDNYSKSYRAGKYMILFVVLTFLVVFLTEIVERIKVHIFQYTLIGIALAIFFSLLLSISEFLGFDLAYVLAGLATVGLIYLYSLALFKNRKSSYFLFLLLAILFSSIYFIIQLEKMALLAGTVGLFAIIAVTMYTTRKIKWYEQEPINN